MRILFDETMFHLRKIAQCRRLELVCFQKQISRFQIYLTLYLFCVCHRTPVSKSQLYLQQPALSQTFAQGRALTTSDYNVTKNFSLERIYTVQCVSAQAQVTCLFFRFVIKLTFNSNLRIDF